MTWITFTGCMRTDLISAHRAVVRNSIQFSGFFNFNSQWVADTNKVIGEVRAMQKEYVNHVTLFPNSVTLALF